MTGEESIEEWDGACPKCGNCNHEDIDFQHGERDSYYWLRCCDCGTEFEVKTITVFVRIMEE
jgi:uncharacterized Zn finger protein